MTIHLFLNKVSFTILSVPSDSSAPIRLRERKKKRAKRISKKVKGLTVSASQKQIKTDAVVRVSWIHPANIIPFNSLGSFFVFVCGASKAAQVETVHSSVERTRRNPAN